MVIDWLRYNFCFQSHLAERSSGMLQNLLDSIGERWRFLVILGYGIAQPVLPAALVDPAASIWRVINSLRAAGWYLLAPFFSYGVLSIFYPGPQPGRWQRSWLSLACLGWLLVAALNAGGDQWDNPRYRLLFLPWMAYIAAWGWLWSRHRSDPWLWRLVVLMGMFVGLFLEWYISRYIKAFLHLSIWVMAGLTVSCVVIFLVGCLVWDWRQR